MTMALDGSLYFANTFGGSTTIASPGLTTANAGDIVVLTILNNSSGITSVTGATLGAFTRIGASSGSSPPMLEVWACFAPSALSGEVVTVVQTNAYDCRYNLFGISGSNQTSLTGAFETLIGNELGAFNGAMPQNYTTTHADTLIIGTTFVGFSQVAVTANNGFTFTITPVDGLTTVYKVLSATSTESISTDQDVFCHGMFALAVIQAAGGGGGGVTGTLAVTEAADVAALAGAVNWNAVLAATEAADVAALTGDNGAAAVSAAPLMPTSRAVRGLRPWLWNRLVPTALPATDATGTLNSTEAADTAALTGTTSWNATLAATEAADTAALAGTVSWTGILAATEAQDTAALAGTTSWNAVLAATEAQDTAAIAGGIFGTGTLAATEAQDVAALTGGIFGTGTLAVTEAARRCGDQRQPGRRRRCRIAGRYGGGRRRCARRHDHRHDRHTGGNGGPGRRRAHWQCALDRGAGRDRGTRRRHAIGHDQLERCPGRHRGGRRRRDYWRDQVECCSGGDRIA
jgi:hypothetical protein